VVPHDDPSSLAKALRTLVADEGMRRTFGERNRKLVASYGVEKCADDIVAACLAVSGRAKAQGVGGGRMTGRTRPEQRSREGYRERVYASFYVQAHSVQGRQQALAPANVSELRPREPYLTRLIRQHFPPDRSSAILDLGCGHGALLYFARCAGYQNLRGVDRFPEQVAAARALVHLPRNSYTPQDVKGLPA
jgi:methylase of polypeptide subunit release factors